MNKNHRCSNRECQNMCDPQGNVIKPDDIDLTKDFSPKRVECKECKGKKDSE